VNLFSYSLVYFSRCDLGSVLSGAIGFAMTETGTRTLPLTVMDPSSVLRGHLSVVNNVLFHPTLPHVYTSGVEKIIRAWSPVSFSSSTSTAADGSLHGRTRQRLDSRTVRRTLISATDAEVFGSLRDEEDTGSEDERMILLFDALLQKDEDDTAEFWNGGPSLSDGDDSSSAGGTGEDEEDDDEEEEEGG
jgi:WD repeat-containing protein 22